MTYEIFASGPIETNSILVYAEESPHALLFDAPLGCVEHWQGRLKSLGKTLSTLLITHSHWDHIGDAALAKATWKMPIGIHEEDEGNLKHPGSDGLPRFFSFEGVPPDFYVAEGEKKSYGGYAVEVIHTPGHTPGGVCFYLPQFGIVVSGDTLFQGSIGRLDLSTARPKLMGASLKKVLQLPKETIVLPGHGDPTTIGEEQNIIERFNL